jgi:hypothetical protein
LQTQTLGGVELKDKLLEDTLKQPGAQQSSYPRMVVEEGKESVIRSVVNQPVPGKDKDGKDSIVYVPIGFAGKFTANQYSDDKILLHIDITNSEIIGETKIGGQIYPVARSSAYRATEEVPVGMSCAVYGWQEHGGNKVEAPGRRPVLYIITPKRIQASDTGFAELGAAMKKDELRRASPKAYEMSKKALGEVLLLLASDAGIHFANLPKDHRQDQQPTLISFQSHHQRQRPRPFFIIPMCGKECRMFPSTPTTACSSFGDIYFGTQAEADASMKLDLSHFSANKPFDDPASALNAKLQPHHPAPRPVQWRHH